MSPACVFRAESLLTILFVLLSMSVSVVSCFSSQANDHLPSLCVGTTRGHSTLLGRRLMPSSLSSVFSVGLCFPYCSMLLLFPLYFCYLNPRGIVALLFFYVSCCCLPSSLSVIKYPSNLNIFSLMLL